MMHSEPKVDTPLFKLTIPLGDNAWHGFGAETVWVEGMPDQTLRLRNSPFFAKGLSNLDVVEIQVQDDELVFTKVLTRGGHSTYRLILEDGVTDQQFAEKWKLLEALGCTYESFETPSLRIFAVDVPPTVAVSSAYALMQASEREGIWDFDEGHYEKIA
jgi:Domain of unknown function (DUF4265)